MAVKASAQITITYVVDVKAYYRYYLLQSSTLSTPSKPTTYPPTSTWDDTEPSYVDGSTNTLYFVDCTVFNDDKFVYSEVSKSSSYEAAKIAYNKAVNAENTSNKTQENLNNLQIGTRNLLVNTVSALSEAVQVSGATASTTPNITWTNLDGILTLTCSASGTAECYYRFMMPSTTTMYALEPGNDYTISGKLKVSTTSGTLTAVRARSQHHITSWTGGVTKDIVTVDTDDWVVFQATHTIPNNAVGVYFSIQAYYSTSWSGIIQLKELQLEKGNKASHWTPAPEDVDQSIVNKGDEIYESMIEQGLSENMSKEVEEQLGVYIEGYVSNAAFEEYQSEVTSEFENVRESVSGNTTKIDNLVNEHNETVESVNELLDHIRIDDSGINLQLNENSMKIRLEDGEIKFYNGVINDTNLFGRWDGVDFYPGNIVINRGGRIQLGAFGFIPRSDGSLMFLKVGE